MLRNLVHALLALLLSVGAHAQEAPAQAAKGSLVIIGGALRNDNAPIWERIVQLAGGKGARIAVFASAAGSPESSGMTLVDRLNTFGAKAFFVPVAIRLKGSDYRAASNDPELAKAVRQAGGAYFAGGDQGRITKALRNADGSNSLMLDALWDMYRAGGVIAGSSAGAAVMSSTMFYNAKSVLNTLKLGVNDGHEIAPGLGFVGEDVFVDQHLLIRGRFARMLPVMLKKGYKLGLGIDENTAMVIGPDRVVEILGYKGALMIDLTDAATDSKLAGFNVSNAKLSYLDNGDKFNLVTRGFMPSVDKMNGRLDPARPYNREPLFYADILGNTTVTDLMEKLIDSKEPEAVGLAFGSQREQQPEAGFEFRFSRSPESVGYQSAATDSISVYSLRLDVRPIQVRQPIYQYK